MGPDVWVAIGSAGVAFASFCVAAAAFALAWRVDFRARKTGQTQLYLDLKRRFMEVQGALPPRYPDPQWEATSEDEREAIRWYWYHCFDEWYVTNRLNKDKGMNQL